MIMKRVIFLLLGASLCLPLAACRKEAAPQTTAHSVEETEAAAHSVEETEAETTLASPPETVPVMGLEPEDEELVVVTDYIPDILVELKYATQENFTGKSIYEFSDVYLRYGTVKKLAAVQQTLREQGLGLKIWDGFRPVTAQYKLWEACPDPTYVADPEKGYSNHSRGNALDVTLVDREGKELEMPTGFDDFSDRADRDYADCTETAADNARLLQDSMEGQGFVGYFGEWWHFADEYKYPVEEVFEPIQRTKYYVNCEGFTSLLRKPDTGAEVLDQIPAKEEIQVLGWYAGFVMARYQGQWGYVVGSDILPLP